MSLARAFTKRIKRTEEVVSPRSRIDVSKISSPITLLSTTNMHALNAPDIQRPSPETASSSGASTHSGHDSDFSTIDRSFLQSSGDGMSTPGTPSTPPMETSTEFFEPKMADIPRVPQRSPTHSKKAHVELSRKRSQRMTPPPSTISRATSVRDTASMFSANLQEEIDLRASAHPFGAELAQVSEVAEGFGAKLAVFDDEEKLMLSRGLRKFGVQDYIDEIAGLHGGVYENRLGLAGNPWI